MKWQMSRQVSMYVICNMYSVEKTKLYVNYFIGPMKIAAIHPIFYVFGTSLIWEEIRKVIWLA